VFFPREELPFTESPIPGVLERNPWIAGAALVIVLEPTSNTVHAGCLGNLNADAVYMGASAHSARPWLGDNAAHKAIASLAAIVGFSPRPVLVEGLEFIEVVNVTGLSGGLARNVIPAEVRCHINFRYAPGRAPQDAEEELASLLGPAAGLEIVGNAPPGAVVRNNPLVDALAQESRRPVAPKQAWTNVAEFTAAGIDAVNFGPGDPQVAHRADERVEARSLVRCYERLTAALIRHAKIEG
jgi:succinyl-diaminopimelate desuccinylase